MMATTVGTGLQPRDWQTWARSHVQFDDIIPVTDRPWARTWQLTHHTTRYYLKQIHPHQTQSLQAMPVLASQFPQVVPRVLGTDVDRGLVLLADHGGRTPASGMEESLRVRLLETYAHLQANAARNRKLLARLPRIDHRQALDDFLSYLTPDVDNRTDGHVGAAYYIGKSRARSFHAELLTHRSRLQRLLERCDELPVTINHGDLRRSNMALDDSGRCLIHDWDEAVAGPAGMSLHNFFAGCSRAARILEEAGTSFADVVSSRKVRRMNAYIGRLVRHGYADAPTLRRSLPAAICLGVLRYLKSYSAFPRDDRKYQEVVADIHRNRLGDLLEMCRWLMSREEAASPSRPTVVSTPSPAADEAAELRELEEFAAVPENVPTLRFSPEEREHRTMSRAKQKLGARLFQQYGVLVIPDAFDLRLVDELREDYFRNYDRYSQHTSHQDALKVGSRRYMVTIALDGAFNSPDVYAPPLVLPVIRRVLGDRMILGSMTAVTSLGGSKAMHIHKDHPALFSRKELEQELPSFGVSMILPLLGYSEALGTTRVWKGSHQVSLRESLQMPHQDPYAARGSVLLMDYRLTHQGLANRTDQVRPILDIIYQRPWFRDIANYGQQSQLILSDEAWHQVPPEHHQLFDWAR